MSRWWWSTQLWWWTVAFRWRAALWKCGRNWRPNLLMLAHVISKAMKRWGTFDRGAGLCSKNPRIFSRCVDCEKAALTLWWLSCIHKWYFMDKLMGCGSFWVISACGVVFGSASFRYVNETSIKEMKLECSKSFCVNLNQFSPFHILILIKSWHLFLCTKRRLGMMNILFRFHHCGHYCDCWSNWNFTNDFRISLDIWFLYCWKARW